jgi:DNA-binding response OmpR family regulator
MEATYAQDERREAMTGMPKVLLVDDAADICQLLIVHYAGKSYGVRVAYDGASALALAERDLPDLVILDLGLPDLDGLEVCRRLRRASAVPIVILTRRSDNAARDAGIAAGAIAYLTKPFEISDLDAAVDAALAR